jgi:4-aminobutyrate aminotransferase-like enzyme
MAELSPSLRPGHPVASHVRLVPAPGSLHGFDPDIGESFALAVERAIEDFARNGIRFAGLLVDTIFSSDGVYADPMGFLARAVEIVHAHRGLFIADEVQPGFGRTGRAFWGFQRHGTAADIVTMGKPMGNGFPMGGVATRAELLDCFTANTKYFNTFGGNPVAAAAGLAVLDIILRDGLMENARAVGDYLIKGLREIGNRYGEIGEVRGAGLFIGLDLVRDRQSKEPAPEIAARFIEGLRDRNILVGAAGPFGTTIKIRPPLCFTSEHADMFIDACDAVLHELCG